MLISNRTLLSPRMHAHEEGYFGPDNAQSRNVLGYFKVTLGSVSRDLHRATAHTADIAGITTRSSHKNRLITCTPFSANEAGSRFCMLARNGVNPVTRNLARTSRAREQLRKGARPQVDGLWRRRFAHNPLESTQYTEAGICAAERQRKIGERM